MMQVIVGLFGIIGNSLSILVLTRANMRNSFNLLLAVLVCFDNTFIFFAVLDYACVRGNARKTLFHYIYININSFGEGSSTTNIFFRGGGFPT